MVRIGRSGTATDGKYNGQAPAERACGKFGGMDRCEPEPEERRRANADKYICHERIGDGSNSHLGSGFCFCSSWYSLREVGGERSKEKGERALG